MSANEPTLPARRTIVVLVASATFAVAGHAATLTQLHSSAPVVDPTQKQTAAVPQLPARDGVLTIDWVDTKTERIAIGGLTYAVRVNRPRIVLASGQEVNTIGYLKPGMQARIESAPDGDGGQRLVSIRVQ